MPRRRISGLDKDNLHRLYIDERLSTVKIANLLRCNPQTVTNNLVRAGISMRSKSEALKGRTVSPTTRAKLLRALEKTRGKGENHPAWKGGRYTDKNGYVVVRRDKKNVREHRWIMEQHLGYKLNEWDEVHHVNGVKTDNRLENLEVIPNEHKHRDWVRRDKAS